VAKGILEGRRRKRHQHAPTVDRVAIPLRRRIVVERVRQQSCRDWDAMSWQGPEPQR
jgi:hypothetical protein